MNEDIKEFLTLAKIVLEKKLEGEVGAKLGIKGASVRRELNRIINYYCYPEKNVQKRSGKKKWAVYLCSMCEVVKREIKRFCFKEIFTRRIITFPTLNDALAYTEPIYYICCIVWQCDIGAWDVLIPEHSDGIIPCCH
jgi:hypothetical protein